MLLLGPKPRKYNTSGIIHTVGLSKEELREPRLLTWWVNVGIRGVLPLGKTLLAIRPPDMPVFSQKSAGLPCEMHHVR